MRAALPLAAALLSGCVTYLGAPLRDAVEALDPDPLPYRVERDQVYTPSDWPQELQADLYLPEGEGPFPAVLLVHPGAWHHGKRVEMDTLGRELAAAGFVAASVDYRLAPQYRFPAPLHDLQLAVRWLRQNAATLRVDSKRIAAWGYSAGGHLASLLATAGDGDPLDAPWGGADTRVQALVAGAALHNLRLQEEDLWVRDFLEAKPDESPALFELASPVSHVSPGDPPTFLYHGRGDRLVPPEHSEQMYGALRDAGVPVELYTVGFLGHALLFLVSDSAAAAGVDFLRRRLQAG